MDIMKYDKKLYAAMIRFGSVDKWRKAHGIELFPKKKQKLYQNLDMIAAIRKCTHELGHKPSIQDYKNMENNPSASTIRRTFGSWSNAICTAGLK